jgi:hypothetical protein
MKVPEKSELMELLAITETNILKDKATVFEKCFCAALLNQSLDVTHEVVSDFIALRNKLYPWEYRLSSLNQEPILPEEDIALLKKQELEANVILMRKTSDATFWLKRAKETLKDKRYSDATNEINQALSALEKI